MNQPEFPLFEDYGLTRENGWTTHFKANTIPYATGHRPRFIFSRKVLETVDGQRMVNHQTTSLTFSGGRYHQSDIICNRFILIDE